ncbi:MAG: T9SS type A sorting domain-containing protein [Bacteroidia bacterium]|nr:T9SS type A sorting domain-containing protein [Bacteroidia bacterium]
MLKRNRIYLLFFYLLSSVYYSQTESSNSMYTEVIRQANNSTKENSEVVPFVVNESPEKLSMPPCGANAANNNFANAVALVVNGGNISGTTCGSLEAGETTACYSSATSSVWYKFTATATTHFVQITLVSGACFVGSAVYGVTSLPTTNCGNSGPISCQSAFGGPTATLYNLTNLTIGNVYHIQILYNQAGCSSNFGTFNIQVTTANPGGTITNPPLIAQCSSPAAGCFFGTPPAVGTVTSSCTSYPLSAAGYNANSVWSTVIQFTSSASWSNFSWQAIITSNCFPSGNVQWLNWTLYDCSCNQLACGNISTLTGAGLACGTCFRLKYEMELANCTSFTTIWPYQNVPSSPTPCTVLPLHLLFFTANPTGDNKNVIVEWEAISEVNVKKYILERSSDGINFNLLTEIDALGTEQGNRKYSYNDNCCFGQETRYYKLTSVDDDGSTSFEKTIAVTFKGNKDIAKFSPNPANTNFIISFGESAQNLPTIIQIYNSLGELVKEETFVTNTFYKEMNIEELNAGIYFVNLITPATSEVIKYKLVKQ